MGVSLDYCLANIERSSYADRDWSNAIEDEAKPCFANVLRRLTDWGDIPIAKDFDASKYKYAGYVGKYEPERYITFEFAPDEQDFQYFTSDTCQTDWIIQPMIDCFENIVLNVICGNTYFANLRPPKKGDTIHYKIGNFVVLIEQGKFGTDDSPYKERITVLLPLSMSYEGD